MRAREFLFLNFSFIMLLNVLLVHPILFGSSGRLIKIKGEKG